MNRLTILAVALICSLAYGACGSQTTTTDTTTSTGATLDSTGAPPPASAPDNTMMPPPPSASDTIRGTDTTTAGDRLHNDMHAAGQDIKEGYKDARDATSEAAQKAGHDVKQGYKNTRDDIKAGVKAAKENKENRQ